jgi:hypothetical protein
MNTVTAAAPVASTPVDPDRFKPRAVAASTFLRDLREECLSRSEKRMPKWKFRLTSDLIIQLQPKASYLPSKRQMEQGARIHQYQFEGLAVMVETGTAIAEMFTKKPDRNVDCLGQPGGSTASPKRVEPLLPSLKKEVHQCRHHGAAK